MTPPPCSGVAPSKKKNTPKKTKRPITQLSRAQYVMEVAHDLYNARRYHLPCLRAQNLTTNHRNGHRLAGCQVPRLVPTCWYQVGQKLAAGSTVNRGAIFDQSTRLTILHYLLHFQRFSCIRLFNGKSNGTMRPTDVLNNGF